MSITFKCPQCGTTIQADSIEPAKVCNCPRYQIRHEGQTTGEYVLGEPNPTCPFHGHKTTQANISTYPADMETK